jgi:hypothetical protein
MTDEFITKPTLGRSVRHVNKIGFLLINQEKYTISVRELYEKYTYFFNKKNTKTMDNNFDFGIMNCYEYDLISHNYNLTPHIKKLHESVLMINQDVSLSAQGLSFFKHLEIHGSLDVSNIEFVASHQAEYYRNFLKSNPIRDPKLFTCQFHRGDSLTLEILLELENLEEDTDIITITNHWKERVKKKQKEKTTQDMIKSYLKRLKDIRAVFIYPKSKPYVYGLTQEGKKMAEISKDSRKKVTDNFTELQKWL